MFRIRQQRVMAILALKGMEEDARAKGMKLQDEYAVSHLATNASCTRVFPYIGRTPRGLPVIALTNVIANV